MELHRRTQMGARPPIIFLGAGLKTTHCALGGDAWRMTELFCWLWHCAATAVALKRHERVSAFNLVLKHFTTIKITITPANIKHITKQTDAINRRTAKINSLIILSSSPFRTMICLH